MHRLFLLLTSLVLVALIPSVASAGQPRPEPPKDSAPAAAPVIGVPAPSSPEPLVGAVGDWIDGLQRAKDAARVSEAAQAAEAAREAEAAQAAEAARAAEAASAPAVPMGSVWDSLAQCESGGNWSINSGNGFSGGVQFTNATWMAMGGGAYAPEAWQASREQQIAIAQRTLASSGWGNWPACSARLGLR